MKQYNFLDISEQVVAWAWAWAWAWAMAWAWAWAWAWEVLVLGLILTVPLTILPARGPAVDKRNSNM